MLWAASSGALEVRSEGGATRLRAVFPYGQATTLAPGREEVIAARAFSGRVEDGSEMHLLFSHSYDWPLAARSAGNLTVTDTDAALVIDATITGGTSWARDFLEAHREGLIRGLSPGFRVPAGGEHIEQRGGAIRRTITRADLFEISAVALPAYPAAQIEARSWETHQDRQPVAVPNYRMRWRA